MKKALLFILLLLGFGLSAKAQTLIDIQFGGNDYGSTPAPVQTGVGFIGSSTDVWNDYTSDSALTSGVSLNDTSGTPISGAGLTVAGTGGSYTYGVYQYSGVEDGNAGSDVQTGTLYNLASSELGAGSTLTLSFTGLAYNTSYTIYLLSSPDNWSRESAWSVNSGTAQDVGPQGSYTGPYQSGAYGGAPTQPVQGVNYVLLTGTTDGSGNLTILGTSIAGEVDVNGLQLQVNAVPEPSTYAMMLGGLLMLVAGQKFRNNVKKMA